ALPCALMGGTLPMLARWLVGREQEIGSRVGALYAANTLGAFVGTAGATYGLLPHAGVREGELVAVALNLIAGFVALGMAGLGSPASTLGTEEEAPAPAPTPAPRIDARPILWATC